MLTQTTEERGLKSDSALPRRGEEAALSSSFLERNYGEHGYADSWEIKTPGPRLTWNGTPTVRSELRGGLGASRRESTYRSWLC